MFVMGLGFLAVRNDFCSLLEGLAIRDSFLIFLTV